MSKSLLFILITLLLDIVGIGIIIPIMPGLIQELTDTGVSEAAQYSAALVTTYAVMQFIFSPIVGGLSDRFGRRPVLLLSLLGFGLDYILLALAPTLTWLFVGRFIAGFFGASITTASAYIADVSPPEKRAQNFGLIGAAFGVGFIIGPALGGLVSTWGLRAPFWLSAGLTFANLIYGYFVLPESLPVAQRRSFDWKRANPVGSLLHLRKYPVVYQFILSLFLLYVASYATQGTWSFFTMARFSWSEKEVGLSLAFIGVMVALVQGGAIRPIIKYLGQNKTLVVGLLLNLLGLTAFAFAVEGWQALAIITVYAFGGIAGPAFQAIISTIVPANEQGQLQGALTSLNSLAAIIGQPIMLGLFSFFTSGKSIYFPGAPFVFGAFLLVFALIVTRRALR